MRTFNCSLRIVPRCATLFLSVHVFLHVSFELWAQQQGVDVSAVSEAVSPPSAQKEQPAPESARDTRGDAFPLTPAEQAFRFDAAPVARDPSPSVFSLLLRFSLVLCVVCAAVYGFLRLIRRSAFLSSAHDPFLKRLACLPIAPGRAVYVVGLAERAFVLAASDTCISLIAEVKDKELIDTMNIVADEQGTDARADFSQMLARLLPARVTGKGKPLVEADFLADTRKKLRRIPRNDSEESAAQDAL
ncbi:flagellar biosynthetic protein FliO [Treponema paraluiscuniculi]|uniref:FliO/MopB family protein n=1 Tax=Treponema paraluiscuniculi TaxID=53435 RepID=UPI002FDC5F54